MLPPHSLREALSRLDKRFKRIKDPLAQRYIAKLCVLETCGWFEQLLDIAYEHAVSKNIKKSSDANCLRNIIKRTHSFQYDPHIRRVLLHVVGFAGIHNLEAQLNPATFTPMIAALNALKTSRDALAHTHIPGAQVTIDAPSLTITRFDAAIAGLHGLFVQLKTNQLL